MSEFRWIPLVWKESKGLEEDGYPEGVMMIWCDMPTPGDEILTSVNGYVGADIALEDDEGCYLESGLDWQDVDAWMPMPPPYRADEDRRELSKLIDYANGFHRVDECEMLKK